MDDDVLFRIVGDRIRKRRSALKMTQERLAELASIDRSHMGYIEQGRRKPTLPTLRKVCSALDISLSQLVADL